jgi:hypothetical protein
MNPGASPGGGYSGSIGSGCGSPQTMVNQTPRYDNQVRKRRKKRKKKNGR